MSRKEIGWDGERICAEKLTSLGWQVSNDNLAVENTPNYDLTITRGYSQRRIQVKASARERGYVTGGSVNPRVVAGGPIFNRVGASAKADFVVFIANLYEIPRYFVMPVLAAETIFRRNVDAYFLSPKLDGGLKKPFGQTDIYVGSDPFPHARIVPDQRDDMSDFEDLWHLLD